MGKDNDKSEVEVAAGKGFKNFKRTTGDVKPDPARRADGDTRFGTAGGIRLFGNGEQTDVEVAGNERIELHKTVWHSTVDGVIARTLNGTIEDYGAVVSLGKPKDPNRKSPICAKDSDVVNVSVAEGYKFEAHLQEGYTKGSVDSLSYGAVRDDTGSIVGAKKFGSICDPELAAELRSTAAKISHSGKNEINGVIDQAQQLVNKAIKRADQKTPN